MASLQPLPYHLRIADYLRRGEPELWAWFSSQEFRAGYSDNVRLEILKSAYRLDPVAHADLHQRADAALGALGLAVPVTLYQSQLCTSLNAALLYLPGEAHLIFSGPLLSTLNGEEVSWVMAHELSHYSLLDGWKRDFHVADQVLHAMASHRAAEPSHLQSARLFRLYTEIFADRGALGVCGDLLAAVSALVKIQTGLLQVSPESYLRQAEEIFALENVRAREITHPELFIRARALRLWAERPDSADEEVARFIQGTLALDDLDLLAQDRWTAFTRRVIADLMAPEWLRTGAMMAHARLFFGDIAPGDSAPRDLSPGDFAPGPLAPGDDLAAELKAADPSVRDYFCQVLVDFAAADPDLDEAALAAAVLSSRRLGLEERFAALAARDLKLKKKALEKVRREAEDLYARAAAGR